MASWEHQPHPAFLQMNRPNERRAAAPLTGDFFGGTAPFLAAEPVTGAAGGAQLSLLAEADSREGTITMKGWRHRGPNSLHSLRGLGPLSRLWPV